MNSIGILAGDLRQHYISTFLNKMGYENEYLYEIKAKDIYIAPIPCTKNNTPLNAMTKKELDLNTFTDSIPNNSLIREVIGGSVFDC